MKKLLTPFLICFSLLMATPVSADSSMAAAVQKGNELWKARKFDEAEKVFKQAISDFPDEKLPYARLAGLYLTNNDAVKAKGAYQDAIIHDPENPRLFLGLALAYMHLKSYSEAEVMTRRALELDPDLPAARKIDGYIEKKKETGQGMSEKPAGAGTVSNPHATNPHGAVETPSGAMPNPHKEPGEAPKAD